MHTHLPALRHPVLNVLLKKAVEWDVIARMPCTIRLPLIPRPSAQFHDVDVFERLVRSAERLDRTILLLVMLGEGEAGLRCGEMMVLTWADVDSDKRQLCVKRSNWKGHVTVSKGERLRYLPLTRRLDGGGGKSWFTRIVRFTNELSNSKRGIGAIGRKVAVQVQTGTVQPVPRSASNWPACSRRSGSRRAAAQRCPVDDAEQA